jgi:L-2,4-diaminobutyrate decarboxylase
MNVLEEVYDAEKFRSFGHQLIDQLADNLQNNLSRQQDKVLDFIPPDQSYTFWESETFEDVEAYFKAVMQRSIQLQHPRYMGHQVSSPAPIAALAALQGAMLNSGGAVYEMSAASSTLEKVVINKLKGYFGFFHGDGIMTSGGTIANLTALICARNVQTESKVWIEGQQNKYAFMVSEEAHYCIDRAIRIMGWGDTGIIKVPVDGQYRMKTELLQSLYEDAIKKDIQVLGVVGSAPTTSTGMYDDLISIGQFCQAHKLWYHIDAAHGGPAAFSSKYRHLMAGSEYADSITVDAHKMMMTPSLTTMLFFKESKDSYHTFAQKAEYLWKADDKEWYNYGKRTMECTKIMMSTRIYALIVAYGVEVFETYLNQCYDLAKKMASIIQKDPMFELAVEPDSNILCFRIFEEDVAKANEINHQIRQNLLEEGRYYIVQTTLQNKVYLRVTIMNAFTTIEDLKGLLESIRQYYLKG